MKTILVLLTILGLSAAYCRRSGTGPSKLNDEIFEIYNMIPFDKIKAIIKKYADQGDPALKKVQEYLHSNDFKDIWNTSLSDPFVKKGVRTLQSAGVDVRKIINKFSELIEMPLLPLIESPSSLPGNPDHSRLKSMAKEIFHVIPLKAIMLRVSNLNQNSAKFKELLKLFMSKDFRASAERIAAYPRVRAFAATLKENGVPVEKHVNIAKIMLGWK